MQRPRRTSEFQDDPGCVRRQSRTQQKSTFAPSPSSGGVGMVAACTSGTAKKYTRQSRIATALRPSSSDRSLNPYIAGATSSIQRGITPQKTPLPKNSVNRVLFTAEKQRLGQGVGCNPVALHNDKKWVHEQAQRITQHLLDQNSLVGGLSTEFLNRGLKQISIKQFVGIINYFLGYIWGKRFTVGTNHVEDITNILQKLQYPHPINKSWLKTPNTQHSFGNVIVLFDFLMDFLPCTEYQNANGMYFDLMEPEDLSLSKLNPESLQVPNLEFQHELLKNSEKGFMLWDKQKNEEFNSLKEHTCNVLIQKKCGLVSLKAIQIEIDKLEVILQTVENERPVEDKEMLKMKAKLSRDLKTVRHDIKRLQYEWDTDDRDIKELGSRRMTTVKELADVEKDIKSLKTTVNSQPCTIDQRDQMIADVVQHKQMSAIKERTVQDLQNRYHNAQILQSKAIKQLNDQIESFNAHMREIKFSGLMKMDNNTSLNEENLELSLRPQKADLDRHIPQLEVINKRALESIQKNKQDIYQVREHCKQLTNEINDNLYSKINELRATNTNFLAKLQKLVDSYKKDKTELLKTIHTLDEELGTAETSISELQSHITKKEKMTEELVESNEKTMHNAEQKHYQCLEQRKAFVKACDELLEKWIQKDVLEQLTKKVELQEKQLEQLRKEFKD